jgi:Zn-finger nucleic acid-binding protein
MLIACPSCHRQYAADHLSAGEKIRCVCGELVTVPAPRTRVARTLHCSSCGGHLAEGASQCSYCGGSISLEERNLGATCPECFARLMKNARYCMDCGVAIEATSIRARRLDSACPRCQGPLHRCTVPQGEYTECASCGGLWLGASFFEALVAARDLSPLGKAGTVGGPGTSGSPEPAAHKTRYLPCPDCGEMMHRKNFGGTSGVIIDTCQSHGIWFDAHELSKIIRYVASGGLDRARQREVERAEQQLRRAREQAARGAALNPHSAIGGGGFGGGRRSPEIELGLDDFLAALAMGIVKLFRK